MATEKKSDDEKNAPAIDVFGCQEKGAKSFQEDSFSSWVSQDKDVVVTAVFDGHGGLNGQHASNKATEVLRSEFLKVWKEFKDWDQTAWQKWGEATFKIIHQSIRNEFVKIETERRQENGLHMKDILDESGVEGIIRKHTGFPMHGGSTGTVVILVDRGSKRRVVCLNVGDSDAILIPKDSQSLPTRQKWKHLSVDHGPDSAIEFKRIQKLPSETYPRKLLFVYDKANVYQKYRCARVFRDDGTKDPEFVKNPWGNGLRPTNVRYDPAVYAVSPYGVQADITCIAMTRALGDFYAHQFGLSYIPDVTLEDIDKKDAWSIVVASDGVWDCWKFGDFADYVNSCLAANPDVKKVAKVILSHTVKRAIASFGPRSYDDTSVVLLTIGTT